MTGSLTRAAGQMIIGGFPGAATAPPDYIREELASGALSGVILFRRNVRDVEQVAQLNEAIYASVEDPSLPVPFIAVDQEGGRVVRLRDPLSPIGPMRAVGARGADAARRVGEILGRELGTLGFGVDFAPVVDVDTNPMNPVIGDRAFSDDPAVVAACGVALADALMNAGVIPCAKHFPGHGDTELDSHVDLPTLHHNRARLDAVELA
ncbi:MAG: glycoside hydrolase family 3 N-terminal domain-containing protein, partial [Myxococcota bacterium]